MTSTSWNCFFTGFSSCGALFSMSPNFSSSPPCAPDTPSIFSWILSTHPTIDHPEHGAFIRLLILYIVHAGWGGERQAQKSLKFEFQSLQGRFYMHLRKCSSFFSFSFFLQMTITKKTTMKTPLLQPPGVNICKMLRFIVNPRSLCSGWDFARRQYLWLGRRPGAKTQKKSKIFSTWQISTPFDLQPGSSCDLAPITQL